MQATIYTAIQEQEYMHDIIETSTIAELMMYHHQTLCSPPRCIFLKAIANEQLKSFPGLTYELISKHFPPSLATNKYHMVSTHQGTQSTHSNQKQVLDA